MPSFGNPAYNLPVTSGWGDDRSYRGGTHYGIDFKGPIGYPIKAVASGYIFRVDNVDNSNAGKWIGIDHDGWVSRYMHLDTIRVQEGKTISKGTILGTLGRSGIQQSAAHLHFDLHTTKPQGLPIVGTKDSWGYQVPSETYIPANYSDRVITNAKKRGVAIYKDQSWIYLLAAGMLGGAYWLWKKR